MVVIMIKYINWYVKLHFQEKHVCPLRIHRQEAFFSRGWFPSGYFWLAIEKIDTMRLFSSLVRRHETESFVERAAESARAARGVQRL